MKARLLPLWGPRLREGTGRPEGPPPSPSAQIVAIAEHFRATRMLLLLTFLALGAADVGAIALESPLKRLVAETLTLLSTHRTLLIGEGNLMIPTPGHTNYQLCIKEVFQGVDTLRNQTAEGDAVEKLFQNLSSIKDYIDGEKKKCEGERLRVKKFLDYLQVFLGVINTEWTMES
ncbi:Interleukin-5 [Myotis brandtii]|uniref:Interleukin-5 n=1 Tax=Myotis brandtii TaxID=109478 RepID=S7PH24_MYOBR|nr:Interleukin-5 [Myotis brandtii]